ncbi:uncharacterized protein LOC111777804 [Cucurbita pepo subsp. pepo]|uniref:uncharacterized protein LOC111777804 n=1 Tax=Cucurbita pepo subsp. pepo TaxID=3664 RepID=UPI000C9DA030|nr:uncharacterized protein LOC111777804 [Cucurbita pepo subsp. pepo]
MLRLRVKPVWCTLPISHFTSLPLRPSILRPVLRRHRPRLFLTRFSASSAVHKASESYSAKGLSDGDLEPFLSCSMPRYPLKVAVLLSGGVDSSVALRLLHAAGHSCTAFYLKIWFQDYN